MTTSFFSNYAIIPKDIHKIVSRASLWKINEVEVIRIYHLFFLKTDDVSGQNRLSVEETQMMCLATTDHMF